VLIQLFASSANALSKRRSWVLVMVTLLLVVPVLAACGGGDGDSGSSSIQWQAGMPPQATQPVGEAPTETPAAQTDATQPPAETPTQPPAEAPTTAPTQAATEAAVAGQPLTDEQLAQYQPNELGKILVLEYHQFTNNKDEVAQFTRLYSSFQDDLQWLYDNGFYVVSMKSVIENNISAPAGKKPVVLTFDDSPVNQFRFLIGADGSLTVDPASAVGIMEAFYAAHPDFGRGGLFGTLPQACFYTGVDGSESDQIDLCSQKLNFLLDNGYEVGNHTLTHSGIQDVDDETFKQEVGGAIDALQEYDSRVEANIFVVPFGMYPDLDKHPDQRDWMQNGFNWNGKDYFLIGSLMVGAEPAYSPVSTEWDSMWIARIQMCDCTEQGGGGWDDTWKSIVADSPTLMYVSDGDPNTITIPNDLNSALDGTFDEAKADGKQIVRY
jgi:peptidoglycan/xylan/chitin deacetylase (PgdA/CDA1 family)